ncbi:11951_t:CDS:2 [Acaulospora colombiana]|uniref:11951_t:CDS:1 n=1 Tax=Acaulospora colombiana TaxID=27376 RepID=A0ACA9PCF9_9GLOM|nr:11951_t:CDS:2 [Acaulospora colombiana]
MEGKILPHPSFEPSMWRSYIKREHPFSLNSRTNDSDRPGHNPLATSPQNNSDNDQVMEDAEIDEKKNVAIYAIDGKPAVVKRLCSQWELEVLRELHTMRAKNIVPLVTIAHEFSPRPLVVMEKFVEIVDIKPDNIVVNKANQELLLIDFGLSERLLHKEAMIKGSRGTPGWTAPELNLGLSYTKTDSGSLQAELEGGVVFRAVSADAWAVGKVIQWLVTRPSLWEERLGLLRDVAAKLMHDIPSLRLDLGIAASQIMHAAESISSVNIFDAVPRNMTLA